VQELLKRYHPGIVAAKYGLTAWITDELARRLVPDDRLSAVFVALICCQPSFAAGVKRGWEQILASLVGILTAIVLLALFPHASWTIGASITLAYAAGIALKWPYPTLLVALFSSLYMSLLAQQSLQGTAVLRCESVALGVLAALGANLLFSPLVRHANLEVRVQRALTIVAPRLAELHLAIVSQDAQSIRSRLQGWEPAFQALGALEDELADLQADSRWVGLRLERSRSRAGLAEAAVRTLEQILHHGLDIGEAVARLLDAPPPDGPTLISLAATSLAVALAALDRTTQGDLAAAGAGARAELARVRDADRVVLPPELTEDRLGPRLIVLVGLAELHHHLDHLVLTLGRMSAIGDTAR
jgi:uncharacterized membrane protein YgaE (UPF0421/DUF939 family)